MRCPDESPSGGPCRHAVVAGGTRCFFHQLLADRAEEIHQEALQAEEAERSGDELAVDVARLALAALHRVEGEEGWVSLIAGQMDEALEGRAPDELRRALTMTALALATSWIEIEHAGLGPAEDRCSALALMLADPPPEEP